MLCKNWIKLVIPAFFCMNTSIHMYASHNKRDLSVVQPTNDFHFIYIFLLLPINLITWCPENLLIRDGLKSSCRVETWILSIKKIKRWQFNQNQIKWSGISSYCPFNYIVAFSPLKDFMQSKWQKSVKEN